MKRCTEAHFCTFSKCKTLHTEGIRLHRIDFWKKKRLYTSITLLSLTHIMLQEQIQSSFAGRENSICRKMPVATVLTPISTIVPGLGDLSLPSSGAPSPIIRHTICTSSLSVPCHLPAPLQPPCHVPAPHHQVLDVTKLQQHVSLDSFTVETVKYTAEVSTNSS